MKFSKIGALLACAALAICAALPAKAASNILNLTNVEVVGKSETATVKNIEFADNTISGDINLKQLNDSVTLALTLENASDTAYKIASVSDNITGDYLGIEYGFSEEEIAPGETTILNVVLTYANTKDGKSNFSVNDYTITINLLSEEGEAEAVINPGTGDSIAVFAVIMAATIILTVVAIVLKKGKRAKVLTMVLALSGVALLPAVIYADETDTAEINIVSISFGGKTLSSVTTMEDMNHEICEASGVDETSTLTDNREGSINSYIVGKASDGNCWMMENLRLGSSVATGGKITVATVNNTTGEVNGSYELKERNYFFDNTYDGKFTCTERTCYYNWEAATAGTGTTSLTSGDAESSICPKGWALPSSSQLEGLMNSNGVVKQSLTRDGMFQDHTTVGNVDSYGYFWSRTAHSWYNAYYLRLTPNSMEVYRMEKYKGIPIRCVAL